LSEICLQHRKIGAGDEPFDGRPDRRAVLEGRQRDARFGIGCEAFPQAGDQRRAFVRIPPGQRRRDRAEVGLLGDFAHIVEDLRVATAHVRHPVHDKRLVRERPVDKVDRARGGPQVRPFGGLHFHQEIGASAGGNRLVPSTGTRPNAATHRAIAAASAVFGFSRAQCSTGA
jgi:hypothetical protein